MVTKQRNRRRAIEGTHWHPKRNTLPVIERLELGLGWGFERDRIYDLKADIQGRYGIARASSIIAPEAYPHIFLIAGTSEIAFGAQDRSRDDGVFEFFGEGEIGDMTMTGGNAVVRNHSRYGKDLLLFRRHPHGIRFSGGFVCDGHRIRLSRDVRGQERTAIIFELKALETIKGHVDLRSPSRAPLDALRRRSIEAIQLVTELGASQANAIARSIALRDYIVARSEGKCEACCAPAPFMRSDGSPYLEVHHLRRHSDGGPDDPRFAAALCPTCHRRAHSGHDARQMAHHLIDAISKRDAIDIP